MRPFFSEKQKIINKITLVDNEIVDNIFENHLVSGKFNKSFENARKNLQNNENSYIINMDILTQMKKQ